MTHNDGLIEDHDAALAELEEMTQERWNVLGQAERERMRDLSGLTPQLIGLEGWRVEVEDDNGDVRRFYVGHSTGWRPCHLEIHNARCLGGGPARKHYRTVRKLYRKGERVRR
jgi:hypothetical protein